MKYSAQTQWIGVWILLVVALVACQKKEPPVPGDAPPPTGSVPAPATDPNMAQITERLAAYRARIDQNPNDVDALAAMGNANFSLGRFDHAKIWYERALKVEPNRWATRVDLASSLRYLGQADEAISELKRVLEKEPQNATALYNLGVILIEDKKDENGAITRWEAFSRTYPDHPKAGEFKQMVETIKHPPAAPGAPSGG